MPEPSPWPGRRRRRPRRLPLRALARTPALLPIVTNCSRKVSLGSLAGGLTVDIAGIKGKLLISPAPGSLAGPAG